jgi:HPt (histidine-containing phosphotransfer) domain-containing protein
MMNPLMLLLLMFACLAASLPSSAVPLKRPVRGGEITLDSFPTDKNTLLLQGEWRFFWNKLLKPEDVLQNTTGPGELVAIDTTWDKLPTTAEASYGFATYLLKINGKAPEDSAMSLALLYVATSYEVYFFSAAAPPPAKPILANGVLGESRATSIPQVVKKHAILPFTDAPVHYLLIRVANHHLGKGGFYVAPELGSTAYITGREMRSWLVDFFSVGMFCLTILYNFSLYIQRREDKGSLYLTIFTLAMTARLFGTGDFLPFLFEEPNMFIFELGMALRTYPMAIALGVLSSFYSHMFPEFFKNPKLIKAYWIYTLLLVTAVSILPARIYIGMWLALIMPQIIMGIYQISNLVRAARAKAQSAHLASWGVTILAGSLMHDLLVFYRVYEVPFLSHVGLLAFIFLQSMITGTRFATAFRTADRLTHHLKDEVERQTRDIKSMLHTINQGLLMVAEDGTICPDYSQQLSTILESENLAGKDAFVTIFTRSDLPAEKLSLIEGIFTGSIGQMEIFFTANLDHLVREFNYLSPQGNFKTLEIDWGPVTGTSGLVEKLLITLRDVTHVRSLQQAALSQKKELEYISEIVKVSPERFADFTLQAYQLLNDNAALIEQSPDDNPKVLRQLFINLHTIKGAARSLQFKHITEILHEVEQEYSELLYRENAHWNIGRLQSSLKKARAAIDSYEQINKHKLGRGIDPTKVAIDRDSLTTSMTALAAINKSTLSKEAHQIIISTCQFFHKYLYTHAERVFADIKNEAEGLARDLGKETPVIELSHAGIHLTYDAQHLLHAVFTHIIRNTLDHGIETAHERLGSGKPAQGTIHIELESEKEQLRIHYADDGRGLNLARIRALAIAKNIITAEARLSPQQIADLVFIEGMSTTEKISEISGRGVGMSAIQRHLADNGGSVVLRLNEPLPDGKENCPFTLELTLPAKFFMKRSA